ncbi:bile acid:sodium symporter family protein [Thermoflavimicrobium daqui]|uniref:Sodium transporter n=1 Tax=Thermoflavimicrobium daqui TaxID=2137476 RepID=A0A364K8I0_9BACL|nr:bile acid:sodium symporter family protein [Thermoflavimicrobium daqui]RAL26606.1 sodium transporter [Thermoflavimicrobium daqui]
MKTLERISNFIGNSFAIWVLLFAGISYAYPTHFTWLNEHTVLLLGFVMFGMGLTLSMKDFKEVFRRPKEVMFGVLAQFIIMPLLAFALAKGLNLPPEIAVGVIIVGCCPGGTASNVMTFLAKGDVVLSVAVTSVTTVLAPVVTPGLISILASQWVKVDYGSIFLSVLQIVIIPIMLGLIVRTLFKKQTEVCIKVLPLVSVIAIIAIVCGVVAVTQPKLATTGLFIFIAVVLHNILGLTIGYLIAKLLGMELPKQKAISIEVGMQNSGLGVALATAHFSPLAAVPSAIFSFWHNISGPIIATIFSRMKETKDSGI